MPEVSPELEAALEHLGVLEPVRAYLRDPGIAPPAGVMAPAGLSRSMYELRPVEASWVPGATGSLTEEQAALIPPAHAELEAILGRSGGRLTSKDVLAATQRINPTKGTRNCWEDGLAMDDFLGGKASVAGPSRDIYFPIVTSMIKRRARYSLEYFRWDARKIEDSLWSYGRGARGIIQRHLNPDEGVPGHVFNVINTGDRILYADGEVGKTFGSGQYPMRGTATKYEFFRTG